MTARRRPIQLIGAALLVGVVLALAGCGSSGGRTTTTRASLASDGTATKLRAHPHAINPSAGASQVETTAAAPQTSVSSNSAGADPTAHAPPLTQVRRELHLELVGATPNSAGYINPLHYVTCCGVWERTDQGVDATLPVGAPILAPSRVKILDIEPGWYAGQPLIYFELLAGAQAGKVQYVAEQITDLAKPGTILQQGQPIARYNSSGTGIEYGWSTPSGITLAVATTGYEEGEETPAGKWMRAWLNSLGAHAGPNT